MKILLDVQGAQGRSGNRGIGRFTLSLALALSEGVPGNDEMWIALNGLCVHTIESVRNAFEGLVPPKRMLVWQAAGPVAAHDPANTWRYETAELLRESLVAKLRPDIVWVSSLFEGWDDDIVTSVGKGSGRVPTAVMLYDLIPLLYADTCLREPRYRTWYYRKLQFLKQADLWLAISEQTREDAIEQLGLPEDRVVNISAGFDSRFRSIEIDPEMEARLRARYGIVGPFVLHTAARIESRKNVEGLIKAFALLPRSLQETYQLVIICDIEEHDRRRLGELARREGLHLNNVVFTGFVADEDLVLLYNLCTLFVFPSLYEGFGLPPLEAMACGAPVIASNTSSLPEVVGWGKALFDPKSTSAIAEKMHEALTNEGFRDALREHGLKRARCFSWEESAKRALAAFEAFHAGRARAEPHHVGLPVSKSTLAYVSPLPPARSGIADYSRELLPELARHYQIELIVDQPEVTDSWLSANFPIRTVDWFAKHADHYDRILYHFGNSEFHKHMFQSLKKHPGVVVLHDFYLSHGFQWMDHTGYMPWIAELYHSHGYGALAELAKMGEEAVIWEYPCNLGVIEGADGIIVHSRHATELADRWYGKGTAQDWRVIPQPVRLPKVPDHASARIQLGLGDSDFLVCSLGFGTKTKLHEVLLEGWVASSLAHDPRCCLVFVGSSFDQEVEARLKNLVKKRKVATRIETTGFVARALYETYLAAADVAVQLRTRSRGETSRAVLDCLAWGIPTVVNGHGWLAELPNRVAIKLPEDVRAKDMTLALEKLYEKPELRYHLGEAGRAYITETDAPDRVAEQYFEAIEHFAETGRHTHRRRLVQAIARNDGSSTPTDADLTATAVAIAANQGRTTNVRQLLVDVSRLARTDDRTGIQRVTRAHLRNLLKKPPRTWRMEPVYAVPPFTYRYARAFMTDYFRLPSPGLPDDAVEANPGDILLGLDLEPELVPNCVNFLMNSKVRGNQIYFVVYDLLPISHPEWFPPGADSLFTRWLETITCVADGIISISRTVADQLLEWLKTACSCRTGSLKIGYYHLGADATSAHAPEGSAPELTVLKELTHKDAIFLMVGRVEPRKGYAQALAAFEKLWQAGAGISLVLVGKQGWMVEPLVRRLRNHPQRGKRLFWLEGASDEALVQLYGRSTALLVASQEEGFGLPLVEAARHGLPIIARDIPVFREVCGDHAFYFDGTDAESLASTIEDWLELHHQGEAPSVKGMPVLTWEESTEQLLGVILDGNWYRTWEPRSCESE